MHFLRSNLGRFFKKIDILAKGSHTCRKSVGTAMMSVRQKLNTVGKYEVKAEVSLFFPSFF